MKCRKDSAGHIRVDEFFDAFSKKRFMIENITMQRSDETFLTKDKSKSIIYSAITLKRFEKTADPDSASPQFSMAIPIETFPKIAAAIDYLAMIMKQKDM